MFASRWTLISFSLKQWNSSQIQAIMDKNNLPIIFCLLQRQIPIKVWNYKRDDIPDFDTVHYTTGFSCIHIVVNFEQPRGRSACRSSTDDDVHLPCLFLLWLPSVSISWRIYNSIWNLHSLLIQRFIGLAAVLDAIFTKAISIILKSNFLYSLLIWSLICFGPLWPYLAWFGAITPRRILPMHLCRSWVRPVQLPPPKNKKKSWDLWRLSYPKMTFCYPPCELKLREPICHKERKPHTHTQSHASTRTSCWGSGNDKFSTLCVCIPWSNVKA